jgi:hypothetical protein
LRGPNAEAGGNVRFDAVADGNDGVKVVEIDAVFLAIGGSRKEILYN